MNIQRASCDPANFRKGRPLNFRPEAIVLHTAMGSINGLRTQMTDPNSATSVHYGIDTNGDVWQFLDDTDTAYHAGIVDRSDWKLLRGATNPNFYTLGVSFAGTAAEDFSEQQYEAGGWLIASLGERWGIGIDPDHVITHRRIRASRNCPGDAVDLGKLIAKANSAMPAPSVVVRAIQVTATATANLRSGAPSTSAPLAGTLAPGTSIDMAGYTTGEKVRGNSCWYMDGSGNYLWAGVTDVPDPSVQHDETTDEQQLAGPPSPEITSIVIDRKRFALPRGQYVDEVTAKDLIVLHFTAGGSAKSAFDTWMGTPVAVATAYLVDLDGKIFETFDPSRWAFHLGLKDTHRHDRRSIGIEIANLGPLTPASGDPNILNWWAGKKYCTRAETSKYVEASYRNSQFYAAFPAAQIASVVRLVDHLCDRFDIGKEFPPPAKLGQCDRAFFDKFTGIATHANFRPDKFDIGPAFDWSCLRSAPE